MFVKGGFFGLLASDVGIRNARMLISLMFVSPDMEYHCHESHSNEANTHDAQFFCGHLSHGDTVQPFLRMYKFHGDTRCVENTEFIECLST